MQILTIEVKDDFMTEFMKFIDTVKDNVVVQKDKNLELDPHFYERKKNFNKFEMILRVVKQKCFHKNNMMTKWKSFLKI